MLEIESGEEEGKWRDKNGVRGIFGDHCGASNLFTTLNNLPLTASTKKLWVSFIQCKQLHSRKMLMLSELSVGVGLKVLSLPSFGVCFRIIAEVKSLLESEG